MIFFPFDIFSGISILKYVDPQAYGIAERILGTFLADLLFRHF